MKTKYLLTFTLLMGAAQYGHTEGAPQKYSNCPSKVDLRVPTESAGHFFSRDCKTVYVLPPKTSDFQISGFNPVMTDTICQAVDSAQKQLLLEMKSLEQMVEEFGFNKSEYKKLMKKINTSRASLNKYKSYKSSLEVLAKQNEQSVLDLNKEIEDVESKVAVYGESYVKMKVEMLERKIDKINQKLKEIELSQAKVDSAIEILNEDIKVSQETINDMLKEKPELAQRRAAIDLEIQNFIEEYGFKKGADASVAFISKQSDLIEEYRSLNRNKGVGFVEMPTKQAFTFSVKSLGGLELPASTSIAVNGIVSEFGNDAAAGEHIVFGSSLGGQIELSQIAACAVTRGQSGINLEELNRRAAAVIVGNVFYEYNPQVHYGYTVKYNKAEVYRRLVETKTKGGFFTTKALRDVRESAKFNENFKIEIDQEESGLFEDVNKLREEIKSRIFDDAVKEVAKANGYFAGKDIAGMPEAPQAAAPILADGLRKCPHLYCQIGAVAVDFAHALFGSQQTKDNWLRNIDVEISETFDGYQPIQLYGSYTFLAKME